MFKFLCGTRMNFLVQTIVKTNLHELAERHFKGRLLDIGCGVKPYKVMLSGVVDEHFGLDYEGTLHERSEINLYGTAYDIPSDDNSFDSVLCTAVLEHLEEPEKAIRECHRILNSGGVAIYSVPFIWHIHEEPRDFYRFSKFGLKYLFEKAGFDIVEIRALSGFWVTFGQLLTYKIYEYRKSIFKYSGIIDALGVLIQAVSYLLDRVDKSERWTWMYIVVARKPECP